MIITISRYQLRKGDLKYMRLHAGGKRGIKTFGVHTTWMMKRNLLN